MTTVQPMLMKNTLRARARGAGVLLVIGLGGLLAGCAGGRKDAVLTPPEVLIAPYDTARGDVLWAVAPLGNESGVSSVNTDTIADALVAKIDEARGLSCLPLNRTLAAMRARNIRTIRTPADARAVATALGCDALLVGNITHYDPYDPPKLGLALALYSRDKAAADPLDPARLKTSYTDYGQISRSQFADRPAAVLSEHLDGANHEVQMELRRYAQGRHDADSALGWRRLLASMDLYTEFAAHFAVSRLLEQERLRLGQPGSSVTSAEPPKVTQP